MSPVLTRPERSPAVRPDRSHLVLAAIGALVAVVVLLQGLAVLVRGPEFVTRVSVLNATPYPVDVSVRSPHDPGEIGLGTAPGRGHVDVREVVDQGDRWVFHFTAGPHEGGTLELSRSQLKREGWRVEVPGGVGERLAAQGATPIG
jgi:hypothetical protein